MPAIIKEFSDLLFKTEEESTQIELYMKIHKYEVFISFSCP